MNKVSTRHRPSHAQARENTRDLLLEAAGIIFAERGYGRTTGKEICEYAGINSAAVNYHFGGMESLYRAVLDLAHQRLNIDDVAVEIALGGMDAKGALRVCVRQVIRMFTQPNATWEIKIISREIVSPSPAREAFFDEEIIPRNKVLRGIVADWMGVAPDDAIVGRMILTIIAPCLFLAMAHPGTINTIHPNLADSDREAQALVDHLEHFILAGLEATARRPLIA